MFQRTHALPPNFLPIDTPSVMELPSLCEGLTSELLRCQIRKEKIGSKDLSASKMLVYNWQLSSRYHFSLLGLRIIFTLDEVAFIQNLVFYIEAAYKVAVSTHAGSLFSSCQKIK